ncbi:hypothetical protein FOZ60_000710 [Perkinsus olseni]|uniref:Uncharacterized protein n=1 Tax=Perkinsus olseni TaxID=32597 RepID=A0A7J6P1R5_PEROL|nr:hypothetical protein FOZ60_000710 [Perkinsus olseni]
MPFGGKGKGKGRGGGPRFGGERRGPLAAPPPPYPATYEVSEFQGLTQEDEMLSFDVRALSELHFVWRGAGVEAAEAEPTWLARDGKRVGRKSLETARHAGGEADDDGGESDDDGNEAMEEYAEVTDNESFGGDDYEITGEFEDEGARGGDEDDDEGGGPADYF